jgi:murein DD-endopeptidase MepM/ murein hydrolase activator NlpD
MRGRAVKRLASFPLLGLLLAMASQHLANAQDLSIALRSRSLRPGEALVATLVVPAATTAVDFTAFGTTWPAYEVDGTTWRALIGIDLDQRPGTYTLSVQTSGVHPQHAVRELVVGPRQFRRRILKVAPDYVNPPPELLTRITTEADFLQGVYSSSSLDVAWRTGFVRPVPQPANSSFGTRSVFNGEPRSPHAGTDFLSGTGTPVHAPAGGRVVTARDLFFTGNTVIIDHGRGVFSMLAHLSRIDVHEGDELRPAQVVGLVGATGRVTGPHLHWALRIGGARVDPLSALALLGPGR